MTFAPNRLRRHAAAICEHELLRRGGRFQRLSPGEQREVADVVLNVAEAVACYLADEAERDPRLDRALAEIYGSTAGVGGALRLGGTQLRDGQSRG